MGGQQVIAIDFCANKGARHNSREESALIRPIAMKLIINLRENGLNAISTFGIANKSLSEYWPANMRRKDLETVAQQKQIGYVFSLHMKSGPTGKISGLTVCSNTNHVGSLQTAISREANKTNFNIFGNRTVLNENLLKLATLQTKILRLKELHGVEGAATRINQALQSYKAGQSNTGLFCTIESSLDPFLTGGIVRKDDMLSLLRKIEPLASEFEKGALLFVHANPASANGKYVPAVLINIGYITNTTDCELLSKNPQTVAGWIGTGIYAVVNSTELVTA